MQSLVFSESWHKLYNKDPSCCLIHPEGASSHYSHQYIDMNLRMFVEPGACAWFSRLKRERMSPCSPAPLVVVPFIFMQSFKETLIPSGWWSCRLQNQQRCYWYRGNISLLPCPAPLEQFIALLQQNPSPQHIPLMLWCCFITDLVQKFQLLAAVFHFHGIYISLP